MPLSEPKRALAHKMAPVARAWRQLADSVLAEFGVSNSAAWCLIHIDRLGGEVGQSALAESLDISQPSLVRTLDQVQAAGLVQRAQHPDDKRSNIIRLTPAGQELVGRIEAKLDALRADLLKDVPDDAIASTVWLMDLLSQRIAEWNGPA
ncbi:MarR family winged helix-turn-helix transcriptional regulator [Sphingobium sp. CR2-8]|uniref:MarR family winged helix-turn-helix transcriptional regulator n=1 Tax=Sphingobium sp. CR2-8 TaxID=1306534 RepID=UPI002DBDE937|nr:MarR family winged helix-turn-helix transcriptional regulator [Sphingobium sp. CR2-8]MEC3912758.1 MarR family winged helix-turn-helix transcriptional regulator [Sphingobium sp. CR2-8]